MPHDYTKMVVESHGVLDRSFVQNETLFLFFFQAEDGIRDDLVTGVQTCALPISRSSRLPRHSSESSAFRCRWRPRRAAVWRDACVSNAHEPNPDLRATTARVWPRHRPQSHRDRKSVV